MSVEEILELLRSFFQAAPALFALFTILVAVTAAVILGNNSGSAKRFRASVDRITESLERSRVILSRAEEYNRQLAEHAKAGGIFSLKAGAEAERAVSGIRDARDGIESALSVIRGLQGRDDSEDDPDSYN
jgi:hypothetical protein